MRAYTVEEDVHPMGVGTPPDFMARDLARLLAGRDGWDAITTPVAWLAVGPGGQTVHVEVHERRFAGERWRVVGQLPNRPGATDGPVLTVTAEWDGFRAADADRIVAALRAFGVLPAGDSGAGR